MWSEQNCTQQVTMLVFAYSSPEISKSWYHIFLSFSIFSESYYNGLSEYVPYDYVEFLIWAQRREEVPPYHCFFTEPRFLFSDQITRSWNTFTIAPMSTQTWFVMNNEGSIKVPDVKF